MKVRNNLLSIVEKSIKNCDFPFLDDAKKITGAFSTTGFTSSDKPVLIFQQIAMKQSGEIVNDIYAYGDGMENGLAKTIFCVAEDVFFHRPDSQTMQCKITDVIYDLSKFRFVQKTANNKDCFSLTVNDKDYNIPIEFPELRGIKFKNKRKIKYFSPSEWIFFRLCDVLTVNPWFLPETNLKKLLGISERANALFSFTQWQHPDAITAEITPAIEAMIQALNNQNSIHSLPGKSNVDFRYWLDAHIDMRTEKDWAWGK